MDYQRIYSEFIADRKRRETTLTGYTELHHILPRSLGGGDGASNLIRLSAGDHLFAHLLLAKIHGGAMWYALNAMIEMKAIGGRSDDRRHGRLARRWYEVAKAAFAAEHSARMKGRYTGEDHPMFGKPCPPVALQKLKERLATGLNPMASEESRRKMGDAHRGKVYGPETREKIAASKRGRKLPDETRARMSASKKGKPLDPETVAKITEANRGKKRSPEQVAAMRARLTGRKLAPEHAAKCAAKLANASRFRGRSHSPETKARMSAVNQARKQYAAAHGGQSNKVTIAMMRGAGIDI